MSPPLQSLLHWSLASCSTMPCVLLILSPPPDMNPPSPPKRITPYERQGLDPFWVHLPRPLVSKGSHRVPSVKVPPSSTRPFAPEPPTATKETVRKRREMEKQRSSRMDASPAGTAAPGDGSSSSSCGGGDLERNRKKDLNFKQEPNDGKMNMEPENHVGW